MFSQLLTELQSLREKLEDAPEATGDVEAVVRIELADVLARAEVLLKALAADE